MLVCWNLCIQKALNINICINFQSNFISAYIKQYRILEVFGCFMEVSWDTLTLLYDKTMVRLVCWCFQNFHFENWENHKLLNIKPSSHNIASNCIQPVNSVTLTHHQYSFNNRNSTRICFQTIKDKEELHYWPQFGTIYGIGMLKNPLLVSMEVKLVLMFG